MAYARFPEESVDLLAKLFIREPFYPRACGSNDALSGTGCPRSRLRDLGYYRISSENRLLSRRGAVHDRGAHGESAGARERADDLGGSSSFSATILSRKTHPVEMGLKVHS